MAVFSGLDYDIYDIKVTGNGVYDDEMVSFFPQDYNPTRPYEYDAEVIVQHSS